MDMKEKESKVYLFALLNYLFFIYVSLVEFRESMVELIFGEIEWVVCNVVREKLNGFIFLKGG